MNRNVLAALFVPMLLLCLSPACRAGEANPTAMYLSADGQRLTARFDIAGKQVRVVLPDGTALTLPAALSASGARYSNGVMTFWEHQGDAMVEQGDTLLFQGYAAAPPPPSLRAAAAQYAAQLKRTDKAFAAAGPTEPFDCQLDAGAGKPPLAARCVNAVDLAVVKGDLASVPFILVPVDAKHKGLPVLADGRLVFLLRRQGGVWRGVWWFLGSDVPSLDAKRIKAAGLTVRELEGVGWAPGE